MLMILVRPPNLCNYCREQALGSALKVSEFSKRKNKVHPNL